MSDAHDDTGSADAVQADTSMAFKDFVAILQSIVVILATVIGGWWTYTIFVKERKNFPSANITQSISHVPLSPDRHLLRVGIEVSNVGSSRLVIDQTTVRVQQILPIEDCAGVQPCAAEEIKAASAKVKRDKDRFPWPLIAERDVISPAIMDLEPGEKHFHDVEFVVPSALQVARVYTFLRNEKRSVDKQPIGWPTAGYYSFSTANEVKK